MHNPLKLKHSLVSVALELERGLLSGRVRLNDRTDDESLSFPLNDGNSALDPVHSYSTETVTRSDGDVVLRPALETYGRRTLVLGRGIALRGMVHDVDRLIVEGALEVTFLHVDEVSIVHGGVFKGELDVDSADVAGTLDGTLTSHGSLIIRATGRLLGTARCSRLQVEDGGQILGRIEMVGPGWRRASKAPARAEDLGEEEVDA